MDDLKSPHHHYIASFLGILCFDPPEDSAVETFLNLMLYACVLVVDVIPVR
jgi:hypothetical protein